MRHAFVLAWRHLAFHKGRTALLVVAIALVAFLPLAVRRLVEAGSTALRARAASTPLVIGARGSELDLVVAGLYFAKPTPREIRYGELARLADSDALAIPLHAGFTARGIPIVGTSLEYFDMRGLRVADGRTFALLGECVLGARAAERVARDPGKLVTDAADPYNLAGTIPIVLRPVGTLAETGTADDDAIFVDIKTAWTIAGIGHGHQEAGAIRDPNDLIGTVPGPDGGHVITSERLRHAEEITPENVSSFHFHGDPETFPMHAIVVVPRTEKAATLLQGSFQRRDEPLQIVRPIEALERLLREILRIERLLHVILVAVAIVTATVVVVVFALSVKLRRDELTTMVRLGAARGTVALLVGAELVLILILAAALTTVGLAITTAFERTVERAMIGG
ncbi:MAG: hypothetical protein JNM94_14585 [Phycisphaerae bacterium]|nr:hypothetical protein [Phycisphaerae bacterium]